MEMHSNNIIKQKIDSINSLPPNYEPNLESKWELLEASLESNKPKPFVFWFNRIGSLAAVLLLFGGIGIYVIKVIKPASLKKPTTAQVQINEKEKYAANEDKKPSLKGDLIKNTQPINTNQNVIVKPKNLKVITEEEPLMITEYKHLDTTILSITFAENRAMETVKKYNRFTEIDFNEPIKPEQLTAINMALNQRFSFKIGASSQNNTGNVNNSQANTFGLTKQFN